MHLWQVARFALAGAAPCAFLLRFVEIEIAGVK
jgi:hypothetical protein